VDAAERELTSRVRRGLLAGSLSTWRESLEAQRRDRALAAVVRRSALRQAWRGWQQAQRHKRWLQSVGAQAAALHRRHTLLSSLRAWRRLRLADLALRRMQLRRLLTAWRRRTKRAAERRKQLGEGWAAWRSFVANTAAAERQHEAELRSARLKRSLAMWRAQTTEATQRAKAGAQAARLSQRRCMRRCFAVWLRRFRVEVSVVGDKSDTSTS
jgi:hypothetical protein